MALFYKADKQQPMSAALPTKRPFFVFNLGHLISLVVFLVSAAAVWGTVTRTIEQQTSDIIQLTIKVDQTDERTRETAKDIAVIKNNLEWIKGKLDTK